MTSLGTLMCVGLMRSPNSYLTMELILSKQGLAQN